MASEARLLGDPVRVLISSDADIVVARQQARAMAGEIGIEGSDLTVVATAVSEIARNIITYAGHGEMTLSVVLEGRRRGILVVASDSGPGIADLSLAMQDSYSTGQSLGMGLPGSRRLMDDFDIVSEPGMGTTVTMKKWVR